VALCQARISTKPLWGFSSSNPYPTQSRAEQLLMFDNWLSAFVIKKSCCVLSISKSRDLTTLNCLVKSFIVFVIVNRL
jgi:hypothetical protein